MEKSRTNQPSFLRNDNARPSMAFNFHSNMSASGIETDESEYMKRPGFISPEPISEPDTRSEPEYIENPGLITPEPISEPETVSEPEYIENPGLITPEPISEPETVSEPESLLEPEPMYEHEHEPESGCIMKKVFSCSNVPVTRSYETKPIRKRAAIKDSETVSQECASQTSFVRELPRIPEYFHRCRCNKTATKMGFDPDDSIWVERILILHEAIKYVEENASSELLPEKYHQRKAFEKHILHSLGAEWNISTWKKESIKAYIDDMEELNPQNPILIHSYLCNLYKHIFIDKNYKKKMRELVHHMELAEYKDALYESEICYQSVFDIDEKTIRRVKTKLKNQNVIFGIFVAVILVILFMFMNVFF